MLRQQWHALPRLIRFMLRHFADGVALGWTIGLILLRLDIGGLGSLMASFDNALLTAFFFLKGGWLFGGLVMGVAVMTMDEDSS
jgi:hypothetical protein